MTAFLCHWDVKYGIPDLLLSEIALINEFPLMKQTNKV